MKPSSERLLIAVIDDDDGFRDALVSLLQSLDLAPLAFKSVREFMQHAARETVQVIVSDVQMPGMTGIELLDDLRQRGDLTPVVLISGNPGVAAVLAGRSSEPVPFLVKPIESDLLLKTLRTEVKKGPPRP